MKARYKNSNRNTASNYASLSEVASKYCKRSDKVKAMIARLVVLGAMYLEVPADFTVDVDPALGYVKVATLYADLDEYETVDRIVVMKLETLAQHPAHILEKIMSTDARIAVALESKGIEIAETPEVAAVFAEKAATEKAVAVAVAEKAVAETTTVAETATTETVALETLTETEFKSAEFVRIASGIARLRDLIFSDEMHRSFYLVNNRVRYEEYCRLAS